MGFELGGSRGGYEISRSGIERTDSIGEVALFGHRNLETQRILELQRNLELFGPRSYIDEQGVEYFQIGKNRVGWEVEDITKMKKYASDCIENCPSYIDKNKAMKNIMAGLKYRDLKIYEGTKGEYFLHEFKRSKALEGIDVEQGLRLFNQYNPTMQEIETREINEVVSKITASKAQKKFFELNNQACGKSAEESAEVFKAHYANLEAQARQANESAIKRAQEVQDELFEVIGKPRKSAQESAKVFEDYYKGIAAEAQVRATKADSIKQAQKLQDKLFAKKPVKSAKESAKAILAQQEVQERIAQKNAIKHQEAMQEGLFEALHTPKTIKSAKESAKIIESAYIKKEQAEIIEKADKLFKECNALTQDIDTGIKEAQQIIDNAQQLVQDSQAISQNGIKEIEAIEEKIEEISEVENPKVKKGISKFFESALNTIKKHKVASAVIALGTLALGAFGLYKAYQHKKGKEIVA
ncbi:MAG: hypothetical protein IJB79_05590 [Candidatus Gastranaerophilales bacterium]|nr:hypothetical protein [bacterium]MBQ4646803.1 hypothetical protein [Candidatus Gastranaerophilales bacterium]